MFGLTKPSLTLRIGVGKIVGLLFGLAVFFMLPMFYPDASLHIRFGIMFWYITIGAIVGFAGVLTENPIVKFLLPWWLRGLIFGGWMNFVLALIAYDQIQAILISVNMLGMTSPLWVVVEGAIVGLVADYFATRFGGEGSATVS